MSETQKQNTMEEEQFKFEFIKKKRNLIKKMNASEFKKTIRNKRAMREFFIEFCNEYIPGKRDFTAKFARQVLANEKKLLKINEVIQVQDVPQDLELKIKDIYDIVKSDPKINVYLPDYPKSRLPERGYLFNIINTVYKQSIRNMVKKLRKEKIKAKELTQKKYIQIKPKYFKLISKFDSKRKDEDQPKTRFLGQICQDAKITLSKRKAAFKIDFIPDFSQLSDK